MKQDLINTQTAHWEVEALDNGMTIVDADTLQKEAALYADANCSPENIQRLLGQWLYGEINRFFDNTGNVKAGITIQIHNSI
jgi:hypothetical protein